MTKHLQLAPNAVASDCGTHEMDHVSLMRELHGLLFWIQDVAHGGDGLDKTESQHLYGLLTLYYGGTPVTEPLQKLIFKITIKIVQRNISYKTEQLKFSKPKVYYRTSKRWNHNQIKH